MPLHRIIKSKQVLQFPQVSQTAAKEQTFSFARPFPRITLIFPHHLYAQSDLEQSHSLEYHTSFPTQQPAFSLSLTPRQHYSQDDQCDQRSLTFLQPFFLRLLLAVRPWKR